MYTYDFNISIQRGDTSIRGGRTARRRTNRELREPEHDMRR